MSEHNSKAHLKAHLEALNENLLFSKNDPSDWRWGDFTQAQSLGEPLPKGIPALWGYPDDRGIQQNGGRPGARWAPDMIRRAFYKITPLDRPHDAMLDRPQNANREGIHDKTQATNSPMARPPRLYDWGNWHIPLQHGAHPQHLLESYLNEIPPLLANALENRPMITLGGGHDFGAVDGSGFLKWAQSQLQKRSSASASPSEKPLIINFDAHLDVRPWQKGLNSGTPFSWLLDHYPSEFDLIEVGIQKQCTSPEHLRWALHKNVEVLDCDYLKKVPPLLALQQSLAGTSAKQACFISLDIDVFSQTLAPGCSQSWDGGLQYDAIFDALRWLFSNKNVRLLGIYEVSPPLDLDHRTSKLAACVIDEFLRFY